MRFEKTEDADQGNSVLLQLAETIDVDENVLKATGWGNEKLTALYNECSLAKEKAGFYGNFVVGSLASTIISLPLLMFVHPAFYALTLVSALATVMTGTTMEKYKAVPNNMKQDAKDAALTNLCK